jgi:hypothetical protein
MTSLLGSNHEHAGDFEEPWFTTSHLIYFPLILGIRGLALSSVSTKDHVPKFALVTGASYSATPSLF